MGPKVPLASLRTTYYCLLEPNYKKRVLSHQSVSFQFNTPLWDFGNPQKKCFCTSRNDIRWPQHCNLQYFWIHSLWGLQMHLPLTQISFILTNGNQQLCRKYLNAFTLDANIFYIDKSKLFSQKSMNTITQTPCPIKVCCFSQTPLCGTSKIPRRSVFLFQHFLMGQKCPIKTAFTLSERWGRV